MSICCNIYKLSSLINCAANHGQSCVVCFHDEPHIKTSGYATWFTAGGAIRIAHCDVIDDVITRKL